MTTKEQQRRLDKARQAGLKTYTAQHVNLGEHHHYGLDTVPTGSLMLDYKLGTGGFPYGHAVEVFGVNRLGKSSAIGYPVLGNVQKQGKLPALLAIEPRMTTEEDREWGLKLGFDPDMCLIWYPDHAEEAFHMLRKLVFENLVDYIMIDSLGGMGSASSAQEDGKKKAYGISGAVTDGLNAIMPRLYKNNIGLLVVNQVRQGKSPQPGITSYDSPGGEALHHHMRIRIQVKPGANRYTATIEEEKVLVGRELTCVMRKNNMSQAAEKTAKFDFFHIETEEYGFGIDTAQDVINVGMISGVIEKDGTNYMHSVFPKGKLFGKPKVGEFLKDNPQAFEQIRQEVMVVMTRNELEAGKRNREATQNVQVEVDPEESPE